MVAAMRDERGFSMIELMIAVLVSLAVLGSAASVISAVQNTYAHQMDDATVEQEARFAMDFIRRTIEQAGSNPYSISASACPNVPDFEGIRIDPNGDGKSIRVQADVGTPDGLLVGDGITCGQANEDVTIGLDAATNTITRFDRGTDGAAVAWTDGVFTNLQFQYFDEAMAVTADENDIRVIRVTITGRSRSARPGVAEGTSFTLESDVRLKSQ
jgi:type II secretory pathway pseudopilin PulG